MGHRFPSIKICIALTAFFLIGCGLVPIVPKRISEPARWEAIYFPLIDSTTHLSGDAPLRDSALHAGDIEIRVWRGFGLQDFEGVKLKRTGGNWLAVHMAANDPTKPTSATVTQLPEPKSGWKEFWRTVEGFGLLTLPDSPLDEGCIGGPDHGSHAVEISADGQYRTYRYPFELPSCPNSSQMDRIAETIGMEFDDGSAECKRAEWIPCAKLLSARRSERHGK